MKFIKDVMFRTFLVLVVIAGISGIGGLAHAMFGSSADTVVEPNAITTVEVEFQTFGKQYKVTAASAVSPYSAAAAAEYAIDTIKELDAPAKK